MSDLSLMPRVYEWQSWSHFYEPTDDEVLAMDSDEYHFYMECFRRKSRRMCRKQHPTMRGNDQEILNDPNLTVVRGGCEKVK